LCLDPTRPGRLASAIKDDIAGENYDGAVFIIARGDKVEIAGAIGFAERKLAGGAH
jgi:hypothetical protein